MGWEARERERRLVCGAASEAGKGGKESGFGDEQNRRGTVQC